jgi:hypothetical protein
MMNLFEFNGIKISALLIVAQDRAAAPIGMTPAVFILQAIP